MFGPVPILNHAAGVIPRRYLFTKGMIVLAQYTNVFVQQIAANGNAVFSETPVPAKGCIYHREGSGIVQLSGPTNGQCFARYLVIFNGNIAVPAGGTAGAISIAIAIEGEAQGDATATVTPAAVSDEFNVSVATFVLVPRGKPATVSVKNISTQAIELQNASLIITRVA